MAQEARTKSVERKAASIKDVARFAGVSISTVSRYLNDGPHLSEQKRIAIEQAIDVLNYRPNAIARALVSSEFSSIAVVACDISLYGPMQLLEGIEMEARKRGYLVSITLLDDDVVKAKETVDALLRNNPVGCILLDVARTSSLHSLVGYIEKRVPTSVINEAADDNNAKSLIIGSYQGGYQITKYLLGLGHRTVWHVSIPENGNEYTRQFGWRQALEDVGAFVPEPISTTWDVSKAEAIGRSLAAMADVTAVFAGNDEIAAGVIRGIVRSGKRVPEDISVAGFDGNPISSLTVPSITTWRQDFQRLGRLSVEKLLAGHRGDAQSGGGADDPDSVGDVSGDVFAGGDVSEHLVIRESTAPPREA
ncbi:LacI family DNA-binding transcriptional regulator [Bifidobacterium platyrrhinorum]|uniref:LacI family DNA-binding transcriptional regulator n=1 Tax=Bifidobacterium platyrrhinorum TaxID=2661628 RepID=A0A6L9SU66_9BIFI|nr:LacI family DNA-binding transcriptional regulator [Bifidobacterium platyrrhinorum]NEG55585.1 LacI family DNA-binding transcriptional regulator [Bifidobacterium platyrrhinorum]